MDKDTGSDMISIPCPYGDKALSENGLERRWESIL